MNAELLSGRCLWRVGSFASGLHDGSRIDAVGRNTVSLLREAHCHGACFIRYPQTPVKQGPTHPEEHPDPHAFLSKSQSSPISSNCFANPTQVQWFPKELQPCPVSSTPTSKALQIRPSKSPNNLSSKPLSLWRICIGLSASRQCRQTPPCPKLS